MYGVIDTCCCYSTRLLLLASRWEDGRKKAVGVLAALDHCRCSLAAVVGREFHDFNTSVNESTAAVMVLLNTPP